MSSTLALNVRIASIKRETDDIVSLDLVREEGGKLPAFTAGSHIDVEVESGVVRQYSLYNDPVGADRYSIAVLREPKSRGGSIAVHERLKIGGVIRISEPRNNFALVASAGRTLLLAGGIGITPLYSMARDLNRRSSEFELHYCTRSLQRAAFYEAIVTGRWGDRARFHFDDGPDSQKLKPELLETRRQNDHLYVCGPSGFIEYVLATARRLGWPTANVHREYFAAEHIVTAAQGVFSVKVASTGAVYEIPPDKTVVAVLREHGIDVPTSCSEGICGTCITKVLDGTPLHRDLVLNDEERAANDRFTPCCSRSKTPLLVLDL